MLTLYDYHWSGAAYRTRIALNLKGLAYEQIAVHLTRDGGEQFKDEYSTLNPQSFVPTLIDGDLKITQSMAIMEYLEETYPEPPLLPPDQAGRTRVRALANVVACDIHPINNLRVRLYLANEMEKSPEAQAQWIEHWIRLGFEALEVLLRDSDQTGEYCHGDTPGMADACLLPQVANAERNKVDLSDYPTIMRIVGSCRSNPLIDKASPFNQPDSPKD